MALPQLPSGLAIDVFLWKDGEYIHFKMKKGTQLKKLMDAYCARKVQPPTLFACVRFGVGDVLVLAVFFSRARV